MVICGGVPAAGARTIGRWIITPDFDVENRRALAIGRNSYRRHCAGINAARTASLVATRAGTAVAARGRVGDAWRRSAPLSRDKP